MAITTVEDLRAHVDLARKVEMSTIPPYLYAAYSIKDPESEAAKLIISVVAEEMLHLVLATNLLLALGGEPSFDIDLMPTQPDLMAHHKPDLTLALKRCSPEVIREVFMVIERPEAVGAQPQDDNYESLGQFYSALEDAVDRLDAESGIFSNPQAERQMSDPTFYGAVEFDAEDSGGLMLIDDAASAREAMEIIIHQGEGVSDERWADPFHKELTHYYKFARIADGESPIGDTWPVIDNPRVADLPDDVRPVAELANAIYRLLFHTMEDLFSGGDQSAAVGRLYGLMSDALAPVAKYLVTLPIGPDAATGPTFEWYEFGTDPAGETLSLARGLTDTHPPLAAVAEALAGLFSGKS